MASLATPGARLGSKAPSFCLPATGGGSLGLDGLKGEKGTVVAFICNHCPYVKAVIDRLIRDARDLKAHGVETVAVCSNDADAYPEDGFDAMRRWAEDKAFPFPYLWDETQAVAKAYGAVCTPDFFGYDADLRLRYRGRLDASGRAPGPDTARRELYEAMLHVARTGAAPEGQTPSIGCSIKWRGA
ncbi:MAG: thioredoxin family protein [Geminicoccaceae bacterium]|nr:thioredoxin family protein [Geminicoccaceae bacterium]